MRTQVFQITAKQAASRWLATAALALAGGLASVAGHQAHAGPLVWSVGLGTPGAVVQVGSHPPPQVVYAPVFQPVPVQVVVAPPPRWYGPHAAASHGHHHRDYFDDHRRRGHHHGHRGGHREGFYVQPAQPQWNHHR